MKKREIELQARLDEAEAQLKDREITIEKSGSIADAAMQLSGVFQAAQEAADTYLKSIKACIGILEIPAIDLKLPVLSEWSYPFLKRAPCRYSGSAYLDNLVITVHNYRTYFGKLKELEVGTEVIFTDAAGNRFEYKVAAVEALTPQSVKDMTSGEWALSLFTCTLDGKNRVTVRCEAADRTSCEVKSERFV